MAIKEYTLNDLCLIKNNLRTPINQNSRNKMKKIYPYYGANGIIDYVDFYKIDFSCILVAEDGSVINTNGILNIQYIENKKISVSNHAHIIVSLSNKIKLKYLYYSLLKFNAKKFISGSVQQKLSLKNLLKINLFIPDLQTQQEIINIIEPFEKNIENIKQSINYLISIGDFLIKQYDLFGKIEIKKICNVNVGTTPSTKNKLFWNGSFPWLNSGALTNKKVVVDYSSLISNEAVKSKNLKNSKIGNTLISIIEPSINKISISSNNYFYNQSIANIEPIDKIFNGFIFFEIRKNILTLSSLSTGTAQKSINKTDIENFKISKPKDNLENKLLNNISKLLIKYHFQEKLIRKIINNLINLFVI